MSSNRRLTLLLTLCISCIAILIDQTVSANKLATTTASPRKGGSSTTTVAPGKIGGSTTSVSSGKRGSSTTTVAPGKRGSSTTTVAPGKRGSSTTTVAPGKRGSSTTTVAPGKRGSSTTTVAPGKRGSSTTTVAPGKRGSSTTTDTRKNGGGSSTTTGYSTSSSKTTTPRTQIPQGVSEQLQSTACPYKCRRSCRSLVDAKSTCKLFQSGKTSNALKILLAADKTLEPIFTKLVNHEAFALANDVISCGKMLHLLKALKKMGKALDVNLQTLKSPAGSFDLTREPYSILIEVLNKKTVESIFKVMSDDHKKKACLAETPCSLKAVVKELLDCETMLKEVKLDKKTKKKLACDGLTTLRTTTAPPQWTDIECRKAIGFYTPCLKATDIANCDPSLVLSVSGEIKEACIENSIRSSVKVEVIKKIISLKKIESSVAETVLACGGKTDELIKAGYSWSKLFEYATIDVFKKMSPREQSRALKEILKSWSKSESKKEKLKQVGALICMSKNVKQLQVLSKVQLEMVICDMVKSAKCPGLLKQLVKISPDYRDFTKFDFNKAKCLGCVLLGSTPSQFQKIPSGAIDELLKDKDKTLQSCPKDTEVNCHNVKTILKKVKENAKTITSSDISALGDKLKDCLDFSVIAQLPSTVLCDDDFLKFMRTFPKKPFPKQCRSISKTVKLEKCLNVYKCKAGESGISSEVEEIKAEIEKGETVSRQVTSPSAILNKLEKSLGEVKDWPLSYFLSLKETNILRKLSCDTIDKLADVDKLDKLNIIIEKMKPTNKKKLGCLKKRWLEQQGDQTLSEDDIETKIPFNLLKVFTEDEMKKLKISCKPRCEELGEDISTMSKREVVKNAESCMECLQPSGTLSDENLASLGQLVCGLKKLDRIKVKQIEQTLNQCPYFGEDFFSGRCVGKTTSINKKDIATMTVEDIKIMGKCIMDFAPLSDKDKFCEIIIGVSENINQAYEKKKQRKESGFRKEVSSKDGKTFDNKADKFMAKSLNQFVSDNCAGSSVSRRKRSGSALTCDTLKLFGAAGTTSLTKENIAALSKDDFLSCVDNFCVERLSEEQLKALADKAKQADIWNKPSDWTTAHIQSACYFVSGLSAAELSTLKLDDDVMESLSKITDWKEDQGAAIYNNYFENVAKLNDSSELEPSHLITLGPAICGADTDSIKAMQSTAIMNSLPAVGANVHVCNGMQKIAFMENVKKVIGSDVSAYEISHIELLGAIIAGLTSSTISDLTTKHIEAIKGYVIAAIPDEVFAGMTEKQLAAFNSEQALSVTDSQLENLSVEKHNILANIGDFEVKTSSRAAMVHWSPITVLMAMICVVYSLQ